MKLADLEFQIAKLQLAPGDILVAKFGQGLTFEAAQAVREQFCGAVPGHRVLIIDCDLDLSVLTRAEIESRAIGPAPEVSDHQS